MDRHLSSSVWCYINLVHYQLVPYPGIRELQTLVCGRNKAHLELLEDGICAGALTSSAGGVWKSSLHKLNAEFHWVLGLDTLIQFAFCCSVKSLSFIQYHIKNIECILTHTEYLVVMNSSSQCELCKGPCMDVTSYNVWKKVSMEGTSGWDIKMLRRVKKGSWELGPFAITGRRVLAHNN